VSSRYLLEESLFIGEVNRAEPESANGEAESPRTGECPPASRGYVMLHPGPGRKKVGSEHRGKSQWTADYCVKFLLFEGAEFAQHTDQ
jgi:hypothetical protein